MAKSGMKHADADRSAHQAKFLNSGGRINVEHRNKRFSVNSIHYHLISVSWFGFILGSFLVYILLNIFFASLYMLVGVT